MKYKMPDLFTQTRTKTHAHRTDHTHFTVITPRTSRHERVSESVPSAQ